MDEGSRDTYSNRKLKTYESWLSLSQTPVRQLSDTLTLKKIIFIIDETPINQLEAEMYKFAEKLRVHIEDAYNYGTNGMSLDKYFEKIIEKL